MNPASTIISDVKIKGTLEFSESLFLDCQFEGDIVSEGKLTIGEHGNVKGQIKAESIIVFGNVKGNIVVTDSCKIKSTATLLGDTMAPKLEIAEGAVIQGNVTVPFQKEEEEEGKASDSEKVDEEDTDSDEKIDSNDDSEPDNDEKSS